MNIDQLNSKVNKTIFFTAILFILFIILFLGFIQHKSSDADFPDIRATSVNSLEEWTAECSNWTIVEEYELVGEFEDTYSLCRADRNCMNEFNEWWDNVGTSSKNELYDVFKVCMYDCENLHRNDTFPSKPYIRYWNETVCIKEILVREVK